MVAVGNASEETKDAKVTPPRGTPGEPTSEPAPPAENSPGLPAQPGEAGQDPGHVTPWTVPGWEPLLHWEAKYRHNWRVTDSFGPPPWGPSASDSRNWPLVDPYGRPRPQPLASGGPEGSGAVWNVGEGKELPPPSTMVGQPRGPLPAEPEEPPCRRISVSSRTLKKGCRSNHCMVASVVAALVVIAAVISSVVAYRFATDTSGARKFWQMAAAEARVNDTFLPGMWDPASAVSRTYGNHFCSNVTLSIAAMMTLTNCNVTSLKQGSVIVTFQVVFYSFGESASHLESVLTAGQDASSMYVQYGSLAVFRGSVRVLYVSACRAGSAHGACPTDTVTTTLGHENTETSSTLAATTTTTTTPPPPTTTPSTPAETTASRTSTASGTKSSQPQLPTVHMPAAWTWSSAVLTTGSEPSPAQTSAEKSTFVAMTGVPVSVTGVPGSMTRAPVSMTGAPVSMTGAPVSMTRAPGSMTRAPGSMTKAPGSMTRAPVSMTRAPGSMTRAPGSITRAPGSMTGVQTKTEAPTSQSTAELSSTGTPSTAKLPLASLETSWVHAVSNSPPDCHDISEDIMTNSPSLYACPTADGTDLYLPLNDTYPGKCETYIRCVNGQVFNFNCGELLQVKFTDRLHAVCDYGTNPNTFCQLRRRSEQCKPTGNQTTPVSTPADAATPGEPRAAAPGTGSPTESLSSTKRTSTPPTSRPPLKNVLGPRGKGSPDALGDTDANGLGSF